MLFVVYLGCKGASFITLKGREHYVHLLAGVVIMFSGIGIQFFGL
jgi:hypothetical protein